MRRVFFLLSCLFFIFLIGSGEVYAEGLFGILKLKVDKSTISVGKETLLLIKVTRDPIVGVQWTPDPLDLATGGIQLKRTLEDLKKHNCNYISFHLALAIQYPDLARKFIDIAHRNGFLVSALWDKKFPGAKKFIEENPDVCMVDQEGNKENSFCINNPKVRKFVEKCLREIIQKCPDIDGFIPNEPTYPLWNKTYKEGKVYCYCDICKEKFKEKYKMEMPKVNLPKDRNLECWKKIVEFRKDSFTEWIDFIFSTVKKINPKINTQLIFIPHSVENTYVGDYVSESEAYGANVDDLVKLKSVENIQADPYWGNISADRVYGLVSRFIPRFSDFPHRYGKSSYFWLQGFEEGKSHVLGPGEVAEAVKATLGMGCDGVIIWLYKGFERSSKNPNYTWEDYFDEFSKAVEKYMNRPVVDALIHIKGCGIEKKLKGKFPDNKDGIYKIKIKPKKEGEIIITAYREGLRLLREAKIKVRGKY